jgi:hypothetical protein
MNAWIEDADSCLDVFNNRWSFSTGLKLALHDEKLFSLCSHFHITCKLNLHGTLKFQGLRMASLMACTVLSYSYGVVEKSVILELLKIQLPQGLCFMKSVAWL